MGKYGHAIWAVLLLGLLSRVSYAGWELADFIIRGLFK